MCGCSDTEHTRVVSNHRDVGEGPVHSIAIPNPYADEKLAAEVVTGTETLVTKELCADRFVGAAEWQASLRAGGFDAEAGTWVIGHPGWRETFALRFRAPPMYGDLVGDSTATDYCVKYTMRLQWTKDSKPTAWSGPFKLAPVVELMNQGRVGLRRHGCSMRPATTSTQRAIRRLPTFGTELRDALVLCAMAAPRATTLCSCDRSR